ncbi:aminotransferase class V-fold PLP-dependent enzyme [Tessaracoccus aquimaris]|uniref:aminotransferase class V-fold PLP-dependent enzyme n=1 Tax=Tessaracoccus aquimaris TaxID=1332264 RepID=UPI001F18E883
MAELLAVDPSRLAFVLNASAGASVVYQSLMDRGPVTVLTTNHGYGAVTMGAERVAARTGGRASVVDIPLNATEDEVIGLVGEAMRAERPTLLVIDQVTSATARAFPVDAICREARSLGVLTLVDGAHAPGVLPDPICREADYWVGNLHKFVSAPAGRLCLSRAGPGRSSFR